MAGLKKNTNKYLLRSLYLNPTEDFDSTLARVKGYMLVNKALDSSEGEEQEPPKKQHRKAKEKEPLHGRI